MNRTEGLGTFTGCQYIVSSNSIECVNCWKRTYAKMKEATELAQLRRMTQEEYQEQR
jgi:nitrate reductase cytochrome c-type subunit